MTYDKTNDKTQYAICKGAWVIHDSGFPKKDVIEFSKDVFNDWHPLAERTKMHVNSQMNKDVVSYTLWLHGEVLSTTNVEALLSRTLDTNQIENKKWLKLIMLTVRLLATQGLEFRDHKDDDSNLNATIKTCVEDSGENFVLHKKEYLTPMIQN